MNQLNIVDNPKMIPRKFTTMKKLLPHDFVLKYCWRLLFKNGGSLLQFFGKTPGLNSPLCFIITLFYSAQFILDTDIFNLVKLATKM